MAGRVEGKVAFITGAARGQGRSHAIRLARGGRGHHRGRPGRPGRSCRTRWRRRRIWPRRSRRSRRWTAGSCHPGRRPGLRRGQAGAGRRRGRSSAGWTSSRPTPGIVSFGRAEELAEQTWQDMIDTNLTGVWHAAKAAIPHLRAGGRGGSIILTSSTAGLKACENIGALHVGQARRRRADADAGAGAGPGHDPGQLGAPDQRRHRHDPERGDLRAVRAGPGRQDRTKERLAERFQALNALPIPWVEPVDISNAVLWLASDEARYVTGVTLPVDAGSLVK